MHAFRDKIVPARNTLGASSVPHVALAPDRSWASSVCPFVAAVMTGLAVTGCALTRQAEQRREVAQRAADDSRCRSYGFKTDADLARCRMQLTNAPSLSFL